VLEVDDDVVVVALVVVDVLDDVLVLVVVTATQSLGSFVRHPGSVPPSSLSAHPSYASHSFSPWHACTHQR